MRIDVVLRLEVLDRITQSSTQHYPLEAGGLLLGYRKDACIEIIDCTEPSGTDIATPTRFVRQDRHHQSYAFQKWSTSGKRMDWIGEWHSHPSGSPDPSWIDLKSWRKIILRNDAPMVFVILGTKFPYFGIMPPGGTDPEKLTETARNRTSLLLETNLSA